MKIIITIVEVTPVTGIPCWDSPKELIFKDTNVWPGKIILVIDDKEYLIDQKELKRLSNSL